VKAKGFKEINEMIQIDQNTATEYKYEMVAENINVPKVTLVAFDVANLEPIQNALFELTKENMQNPEEGLSDHNGQYTFKIKQVGV
jgi:hypothetical protein